MDTAERLSAYKAFSDDYIAAVHVYAASRPSQHAKAPWLRLIAGGLQTLRDIPADEFAPKAHWLLKAFPELAQRLCAITDFLPADASLVERQYCVYYGITERKTCEHCGAPIVPKSRFRFSEGETGGYSRYCSIKCGSSAEGTISRRKATNISRIGVPVPAQSKAVRDKMASTTQARHGVTHYAKTEDFKGTMENLYGGPSPFSSATIQEKKNETLMAAYGTTNVMAVQELADKAGDGRRKHAYAKLWDDARTGDVKPAFTEDEYKGVMRDRARGVPYLYPFHCNACGEDFEGSLEFQSYRSSNVPRCPVCNPQVISAGEAGVLRAIREQLPGHVIEQSDRAILDGYEVDILLPGLGIGVEFNGLYWHSSFAGGKGQGYHQSKLDGMAAAGHRLIYVWEDEWRGNTEAVEQRVALACTPPMEVDPRDLSVDSGAHYRELMEQWHRDGSLGGVVTTYCLHYEGIPAAVLQVAQRPAKPGRDAVASLRYAPVGRRKVKSGFAVLFEAARAASRSAERRYVIDADPSWDDTSVFAEAGMRMAKDGPQDQWYLFQPNKYHKRRSRTELIEAVAATDPELCNQTRFTDSRLQAVGADRIWGVRRQVWEYVHKA